jgi:FkbM family methyltransferase
VTDATKLKRTLVGTAAGRLLMRARQRWDLVRAVLGVPEQGGAAAQDAIARALLPRLCRPGNGFVDAGAHIGSVIAEVKECNPSARIVAIEAIPEKAAYLTRRHGDVTVHAVALGDHDGEVSFFVDARRTGYSSLGLERGAPGVQEITVPMRRLDALVPADLPVDVVKIDVEGAELGVLRGAVELVARCRPVVVFESGLTAGAALGYTVEGLYDWFAERSYDLLVPNRVAHDGPPLSRDAFVESHYYPRRTLNYFAVARERRTHFRDGARAVLGIR